MRHFITFVLILLGFLFIGTKFIPQTYAQEGSLNLTVSPVFFEYKVDKAQTIKDKIRIRNNSSESVVLHVDVRKLSADSNGSLTIEDKKPQDTYLNWVKPAQTTLTAPPREWIDLPFTLSVPPEAAFGYYMAISLSTLNKQDTSNTVSLTGMSLVPILLNVDKPGAKAEASLIEFKSQKNINEYLPIDFTTTIQNTGNVHIRPRGNIFISGPGNKDLAILEVNEDFATILPQAKRSFVTKWSDGFFVYEPEIVDGEPKRDANGNVVNKLTINWNKLTHFRFGKYTANLFLVFDNGKRDVTIEGSTSFWVIPYIILTILFIFIVIMIVLIKFILKLYIQKEVKKRISG